MPEIANNTALRPQIGITPKANPNKNITPNRTLITGDEYFRRERRKNNGLIEKMYNWIKNTTGLGWGSEKIQKKILEEKNGKISKQELAQAVHNYNSSQENAAQLAGDAVSVSAAGFTFYKLNQGLKYTTAGIKVNKPLEDSIRKLIKSGEEAIAKDTKKSPKYKKNLSKILNLTKKTLDTLHSNKKMTAISVGFAALAGGIAKYWTLKLNRIGSQEFKVDEKVYGKKKLRNAAQKSAAKQEKKRLKAERRKTNFKNFLSGTINGLMMPLISLGGVIGAPLYLIGNSLNRYFVAQKTDKNKSLKGYADNLSNDILATGLTTAALAVPLVKKGNYTKVFNENITKVSQKLADAKLKEPDVKNISAYKQLEDMLLDSPNVKTIINNDKISMDNKIKTLTQENLFAVKMKQISNDNSPLSEALKEKCPPTRTLEQAQNYINQNLGEEYKVRKLLGVGTVAETYLAKSPDGREVCVKILKDGITKEKILQDKEKFIETVKNITDKTADEKEYLLRNIDDLADGILKEVDLKNEMDAALELAKHTNVAHVVKPVKVKNNVYVMEKANGISLASFLKMNSLYLEKEAAEKLGKETAEAHIKEIEKRMQELREHMPDFTDIKFNKHDADFLLNEYQKVFIEQFHKINKNGKAIHADIHPGNIFIDPNVLRTRKGKLFTLIDTGNVINLNAEQSLHALNLTNYVKQGNIKDIAEYVLDGAKLPSGMTQKEAVEKVSSELKKYFFDFDTKITTLNNEKVLTLTDGIMQKFNIIPNSTQLNMYKSRVSATNSLDQLRASIMSFDFVDVLGHESKSAKVFAGGQKGMKYFMEHKLYEGQIAKQEKENLKQLTQAQRLKQKKNPNAPKTNSEEYLTYKLKQIMAGDVKFE